MIINSDLAQQGADTGMLLAASAQARSAATVTVTEGKPSEFAIRLGVKSVAHGTVTFKVTNKGMVPHDFRVCAKPTKTAVDACAGKGTKTLAPGQSGSVTVTFKAAGTYEYLCTIAGHATAGMKGLLKVT